MNLNEQEMENLLRGAPQPKPTTGLRKQLVSQIRLPNDPKAVRQSSDALSFSSWLRRWWPALAPATLSLACGVVMAVQRVEMRELKVSIQAFGQTTSAAYSTAASPTFPATDAAGSANLANEEEIARLEARTKQLSGEITQLEQLRVENEKLRKDLAELARQTSEAQTDADALAKARANAQRIACVNNLKQVGIALRGYEIDMGTFPPDLSSISNEVNSLKVLICPADTNRPIASSWTTVTAANCSYDFLAVSGDTKEPDRVAFRCPIHGNILTCDGAVQSLGLTKLGTSLVERNGKLYLSPLPRR